MEKNQTQEKNMPKVNSQGQKELEVAKEKIDSFTDNVQDLVERRMNFDPTRTANPEPQTKLALSEIDKMKDIYLRPAKAIGSKEPFNEKFRASYNFDKEPVKFIAENKELIGEAIEIWTKPYPGMPAEFWVIPTNKPVYAPRYVAEQLKRKFYHRLKSEEKTITGEFGFGQTAGMIVVDTTVQRLDANPVSTKRSIFMGGSNF